MARPLLAITRICEGVLHADFVTVRESAHPIQLVRLTKSDICGDGPTQHRDHSDSEQRRPRRDDEVSSRSPVDSTLVCCHP
jgi:hypothetical protein